MTIMEINKKAGTVEINIHEVMALRLSGMPYTSSDTTVSKTVATELGLAYNNMAFIRKSVAWGLARENFVSINTLEDSQVSLLSGFNSITKEGKSLVMTKGDVVSLGMRIAHHLGDDLRNLIIDSSTKDEFLNFGINGFVESIAREQKCLESQKIAERNRQIQERKDARIAELRDTAIATLVDFDIAEPTGNQVFKMASALVKAKSTPEDSPADSPDSPDSPEISWDETLACIREFESSTPEDSPESEDLEE